MSTALALLASTYLLVLFLGLQSLNVNNGHKRAAVITSLGIGLAHLTLYKLAPQASGLEIAAYLAGGPLGILSAMALHPRIVGAYRRDVPSNAVVCGSIYRRETCNLIVNADWRRPTKNRQNARSAARK